MHLRGKNRRRCLDTRPLRTCCALIRNVRSSDNRRRFSTGVCDSRSKSEATAEAPKLEFVNPARLRMGPPSRSLRQSHDLDSADRSPERLVESFGPETIRPRPASSAPSTQLWSSMQCWCPKFATAVLIFVWFEYAEAERLRFVLISPSNPSSNRSVFRIAVAEKPMDFLDSHRS